MNRIKLVLIPVALLLVFSATVTRSQAKPFYQGETITLIVATKAGGGYDFYGRLIGKFMQKYLPGSTVIVKNVPGAGHIIGTNAIYSAKPDGLTIGIFNRAIPFTQIAGLDGVRFDLTKMSWIGSATPEPSYSFIVTDRFKSLDDVSKADRVIVASGGAGNFSDVAASLFIQMSGLDNLKIVRGYYGNEPELAMMRGEVDGQFVSFNSVSRFVEDQHAHPVLFIGDSPVTGYEQVPLISEVITDEQYRPVVNLLLAVNILGRPFAGPPGIPQERLEILRDAFEKACSDPGLLEIASKAQRPIKPITGERAQQLVAEIIRIPEATRAQIKASYGAR